MVFRFVIGNDRVYQLSAVTVGMHPVQKGEIKFHESFRPLR